MTIVSDGDLPCQSKGATSKADDDALSIKPHSQVNRAHPKLFIRDDTALSETSGIGACEGVYFRGCLRKSHNVYAYHSK